MDKVKESLTRKIGPLPVWAWALIGGIILYVVRQRQAASGAGQSNTAAGTAAEAQLITAEGQAAAQQLQSPLTISPGESVYDPNNQLLQGGSNSGNAQENSILKLIAALLLRQPSPHHHHKKPHHKKHRQKNHKHIHGKHHNHPGHHQPANKHGAKK